MSTKIKYLQKTAKVSLVLLLSAFTFISSIPASAAPVITPYPITVLEDTKSGYSKILASSSGDVLVLTNPSVLRYGQDGTLKDTYIIPYEQGSVNRYRTGLLEDSSNNIWFTTMETRTDLQGCTGQVIKLNKIAASGLVSQFTLLEEADGCGGTDANSLALDSQGNFWVSMYRDQETYFMVVSPSGEILHNYPLSGQEQVGHSTLGPDGNIWYLVEGKIGKITEDGSEEYFELEGGYIPIVVTNIVKGPDDKLWFGCNDPVNNKIGLCSMDTDGNSSNYPQESNAFITQFTIGPDHKIWFSGIDGIDIFSGSFNFTSGFVGTVGQDGTLTKYQVAGSSDAPTYMTQISGSSKSLWASSIDFTDQTENAFTHPTLYRIDAPIGGVDETATPAPPKTGKLIGATLITVSILGGLIILVREYQDRHRKRSVR